MTVSSTASCERCATPLEQGDLRCAICGQATPTESTVRSQLAVKIHRCTGCGAAVAYDPDKQAPSCTFCNEVVAVETIEDPIEQSEGYLPFTIGQSEAHRALSRWLVSLGWFRPSDLSSSARLDLLKPLWWVGWIFDADAHVTWAADSDFDSRRSAWAPHSGSTPMVFKNILVSASRGLSNKEVDAISGGCDLHSVRSEPEGVTGGVIEQFDLQRSQARQQIVSSIENFAAYRVENEHVPGTVARNVNASVLLQKLVTRRLSFPAWILAYRYRNRLYRVVVCGQDGTLVSGNAPVSWFKILLVGLAVVAAVVVGIAIAGR